MEDAHIALLKVPHGKPPTAAAIGAARIGLFSSQSNKPPLGNSSRGGNGGPSGSVRRGGGCLGADAAISRGRSGTFSAGDTREFFPQQQQESRSTDGTPPQQGDAGDAGASAGASSGRASAGISTGDEDKATTRLTAGGGGGGEESGSAGAGWKAVDLLEDAALFGVFDGHGGKAVADFCKERLPGQSSEKKKRFHANTTPPSRQSLFGGLSGVRYCLYTVKHGHVCAETFWPGRRSEGLLIG